MDEKSLIVFEGKNIRRVFQDERWWFSVIDVIGVLTDSLDARNYWKVLKNRLGKEGSEVVTKCNQLKLESHDGKKYLTDVADIEGLFRIIQSIPSPKAEPFKRWLARVGYERVMEIEDPELAGTRMKEIYKQKGYSGEWIEKRVRGVAVRNELTDEWKKRGVKQKLGFAILTNEISKATFGLTVGEYKKEKNLDRQNLRDHMDDMELILTMLGEATTTRLTKTRDSKQFPGLKRDAKDGGKVAGSTRKDIEKRLGKSIVSKQNYLNEPEGIMRKKLNNGK